MSDPSRRYSDDEVRRIIERALSLQKKEQSGGQLQSGDGSTLDEIDVIGKDVGLSPDLIRRAAADVELRRSDAGYSRFLGGKVEIEAVTTVGRTATEKQLEKVFLMLHSLVGETGLGSVMGSYLSWSSTPETVTRTSISTDVTVTSSGDTSAIQVRTRLGQLAGGIFGGVIGGVGLGGGLGVGLGVGLGALSSLPFAILFPLVAITGSYFLSRAIYHFMWRSKRKHALEIAEKIKRFLESDPEGDPVGGKE